MPRGGTCARAKSTYCDLSSFVPPLFEIWWPDMYLGGPYGPVKDNMYWPGGLKSATGQCLCRGLRTILKGSTCCTNCVRCPPAHDRLLCAPEFCGVANARGATAKMIQAHPLLVEICLMW